MKVILSLIPLLLFGAFASAQCTLDGWNTFHCTSDTVQILDATCGSTPNLFGPGITSSGNFDPAQAGAGWRKVYLLDSSTSYTIDQSGIYDTIGVPSNATSIFLGDDQAVANLPVGFDFRFFDRVYDRFGISSNGLIYFGNEGSSSYTPDAIPNSNLPNGYVAFAWEDLNPLLGSSEVNYYTVGTYPNRRLVVNFIDVQHFGGGFPVTAQVQLWEGCGRIEIHTTSMPAGGGNHVMGIEAPEGAHGHPVPGRNNTNWSASNDFVAFIPGCGDTFTTYISHGPELTLQMDSLECFDAQNGALTVFPSGQSPFSYEWSTGDSTFQASSLGIGTYFVTVTDGDGCSVEESEAMYSPPALEAQFEDIAPYCESDTTGKIWVLAGGGVSPYQWSWFNGSTNDTIHELLPGDYTLTVTDANACSKSFVGTVGFLNASPNVNLGDDKSICPGQNTVLIAPPGYPAYEWSDGSSGNSLIINQPGNYGVTVTSDSGCFGVDDLTVAQSIPIYVDLGPDRAEPGPINLDAGAGYKSYFWNTGATTRELLVTISGVYQVTVQDTLGCFTSDTARVDVWAAGVEDPAESKMELYPNPTDGAVFIRGLPEGATCEVEVMNLLGEIIERGRVSMISDVPAIQLGRFPPGTYLIRVRMDGQLQQQLIILR